MVAISSSQKKTVFAVILLALIAAGVMISGRGGFSGLRSDVFNNPSFVCTNESLVSGEVRYSGAVATIQNLSNEKTSLQAKVQGWSADIRKNEAQIKKLEKEETAAEKKERALEVAVKKQCTPRALATCAAKKQELQDIRQEIKKIRNSLVTERNQNKNIKTNIQSAESSIKLLEKQIQEIQNFKEDFYTCKMALEKEKTEVASFDLIVSGEVFVNEPFDITVRAMKPADTVNNKYEGKIFFDTNNNPADVVLPLQENDGGSEYQFQAADNGIKVFTKGLTLKKAGTYEIVVFELRGSNGGVEKKVQVVAKEKTSPVTCTDSDNGLNYYTKGQTTLSNGVISTDFCSSTNTLDEYICPVNPSESGVSQSYTCPYGCSEGECKTPTTNENKITAEYVESRSHNRTVYLIPHESTSFGHDTSHNFYIKSTEDITIRELTIKTDHPESIRYIWVGGPANKTAVIDGKAVISGLNQYVRGNSPTSLIQIFVQYNSAGVGGIPSNTSSKITITGMKYDNAKSERIAQSIEPSSSIAMYIVGAIPNIYPDYDYNFYGLAPGVNKIGEFSIIPGYANSNGIKINEITISLSSNFSTGTDIENIQLKKNTGETYACNKVGGVIKCNFGTNSKNDFDGYLIPAGYHEIFKIYGTVNGPISDDAFISTKIDVDNFNWDDTTTNGSSGINLSGKYLPGNKMGIYTLRK